MDKRKEAWRLHVEANMPVRAIAQALGVPVGTVKAWLHRDRRRGAQPATDTGPATTATDATNATLQPAGGATDGATATRTATGATCDGYILPDTATDAGATAGQLGTALH
jgi:transposase